MKETSLRLYEKERVM